MRKYFARPLWAFFFCSLEECWLFIFHKCCEEINWNFAVTFFCFIFWEEWKEWKLLPKENFSFFILLDWSSSQLLWLKLISKHSFIFYSIHFSCFAVRLRRWLASEANWQHKFPINTISFSFSRHHHLFIAAKSSISFQLNVLGLLFPFHSDLNNFSRFYSFWRHVKWNQIRVFL